MSRRKTISIPVSAGELIDKITILEIKAERFNDTRKLRHVKGELQLLRAVRAQAITSTPRLTRLTRLLKSVNEELWEIEEGLRLWERKKQFGSEFVELARSVYHHNDRRSQLKRRIDALTGSSLVEEKSYSGAHNNLR